MLRGADCACVSVCVPVCSEYDKEALAALGSEFEIDFISLAYTRTRWVKQEGSDSYGLQEVLSVTQVVCACHSQTAACSSSTCC